MFFSSFASGLIDRCVIAAGQKSDERTDSIFAVPWRHLYEMTSTDNDLYPVKVLEIEFKLMRVSTYSPEGPGF